MNIQLKTGLLTLAVLSIISASCKKDITNPLPEEQELITTVRLRLTAPDSTETTYIYKIENGFNSTSQGTVQTDTLRLLAGQTYTSRVEILNEKANPPENTTLEIIAEQTQHLFLYLSKPAAGAGSVSFTDGNKDSAGLPFNLEGTLTAGPAGAGTLQFYLIHQPRQ